MAETDSTLPNDLVIYINPEVCIFMYTGTRAMLEDEGVIPRGMEWPNGFDDITWQDNRHEYWLRRERPEGARGARRDFLHIDWWCLRFNMIEKMSWQQHNLLRKKRELEEAVFNASAQGIAAMNAHYQKWYAARDDNAFQKLLAQIPGLLPKPRTRKGSAVGS